MSTENIVKFLQTAYSDEKLAALLAHAQDGKLAFRSCCCFIGVSNATHALKTDDWINECRAEGSDSEHYNILAIQGLPHMAEREFFDLGNRDTERRAAIIPLILAEMERREKLAELPDLTPSEQERQEEIEAEREGMATEMSGYADPGTSRF